VRIVCRNVLWPKAVRIVCWTTTLNPLAVCEAPQTGLISRFFFVWSCAQFTQLHDLPEISHLRTYPSPRLLIKVPLLIKARMD
ncbi:hypothetical protein, partial [Pseudomonas rhodesiae]|uniref:hypothetical protein n=1 Tax=Pseudomonas rhodesiae TaxID=76760 RepID=UPI00289B4C4E